MKKKIGVFVLWAALSLIALAGIIYSEINACSIGAVIGGVFITIFVEKAWDAGEDLFDESNWETTLRRLLRGKVLKKDSLVRISFAYLYRIKIGSEYLLIKNNRGTGKYQPIGGVYKLKGDERIQLNKMFHVVDDNKIPIDSSSRDDYRLQMPCRYLKRFIRRFNSSEASRERIDNISREFKEELSDMINWDQIKYRYCGRHLTDLLYDKHFQCYELLLADIVELIPTELQKADLEHLKIMGSHIFKLVTADEINGLGVRPGTDMLQEWIADHSIKILQENEQYLSKEPGTDKVYTVKMS